MRTARGRVLAGGGCLRCMQVQVREAAPRQPPGLWRAIRISEQLHCLSSTCQAAYSCAQAAVFSSEL